MFRSGFFALAVTVVGAIIVLYHVLSGGGLSLSIGFLIGVLCMADGVLRLLLMQRGER
jgi:hypothetical protein